MTEQFATPITPDGEEVLRLCLERLGRTEAYKLGLRMGFSATDTARAIGVSPQAADQWAKYNGLRFRLDFNQRGFSVIADLVAKAAELGLRKSDVAGVTGLSVGRIARAARRHGIAIKRDPRAAPRVKQIQELAAQGLTVGEVARALGIHRSRVSHVKKTHGIEFHRDGRKA